MDYILLKYSFINFVKPFVKDKSIPFWIFKNTKIERAIINDINPDSTKAYLTVKENITVVVDNNEQTQVKNFSDKLNNKKNYWLLINSDFEIKTN